MESILAYYRKIRRDPKKAHEEYTGKMYKRLEEFRADGTFCDFVLIAGQEQIAIHKVIMSICSDYFYAMVTLNMKEKDENTITLDAIDGAGLRAVVNFAYSGEININLDNVSSILQAASYLQVMEVVRQCEVYLNNEISPDNCLITSPLIELYGIDKKYPDIANYMYTNFHQISDAQRNTLSRDEFIMILKDDRLRMSRESSLLAIVKKWMEFNKHCIFNCSGEEICPDEEPWETFTLLMSEIRWCLISEDELRDIDAEILAVMNAIPKCRELLQEAKCYHADIYRQPLMQSSRSKSRYTDQYWVKMLCHRYTTSYDVHDSYGTHRHKKISRSSSRNIPLQTAVVFNNFMFVCGGKDSEMSSTACFRYDPRFNKWMDMSALNFGRRAFVLLTHNKNLYAIGGIERTSWDETTRSLKVSMTGTCETYDIEHNTWSIIPEYNVGIGNHAGCVVNDDIYISGGFHTNEPPIHSQNEVSRYNITTGKWADCAPMTHARSDHVMENIAGVIYVICGRSQVNGGCEWAFVETVERYSVETNQWTNCKQTVRYRNCSSVVRNDKIYILGEIDWTENHSYHNDYDEDDFDDVDFVCLHEHQIMIFSEECDNVYEKFFNSLGTCTAKGSALLSIPFQMESHDPGDNYYDGDDYDYGNHYYSSD